MNETRFLTREQRYAGDVYTRIQAVLAWSDEQQKKQYGSLAHKLPVLIRTNGLAQALAFVAARNTDDPQRERYSPQLQLIKDLAAVLIATNALTPAPELPAHASDRQQDITRMQHLLTRSRDADFNEYLRLTESALEALLWFKRFAQSELQVDSANTDQEVEGRHAT